MTRMTSPDRPKARASPRATRVLHVTHLLVYISILLFPNLATAVEWQAPICGARTPAECVFLTSWEKDVRALQALHRECGSDADGVAQVWTGVWGDISTFAGTREQWDVLCEPSNSWQALSSDDEVKCDRNGRVLLLYVDSGRHRVQLNCPNGFPPEFADLSYLAGLRIDGALRSTPSDLPIDTLLHHLLNNQNLMELSLPDNDLVGVAPALCDFRGGYMFASRLSKLRLNKNKLSGAPPVSLTCAHYLETLDLSNNDLAGTLPDDWSDLASLSFLSFGGNPLITGALPTSWFPEVTDEPSSYYRLGNLKELDGSDCGLTGSLPSNLGGMQKLENLFLHDNELVGQIPSSITRLTNLRELNLNSNRFTGPLPSDLFTSLASSLKTFDVSHNELTGSLPNLPNAGFPLLKELDVSDNYFSGTFPGFGAVNLFTLNLGKNQFSGTFPSPCTSSYLSHIEIQGNQFGDALPDLSCLNELWFLDASRNKFDSAVSLDWIASGSARDVNLAFNQIDEPFPSDICGVNTKTLDLRGNNLTGPVPATIGNCVNLHELHLGHVWSDLDDAPSDASSDSVSTLPSDTAMVSLTELTHLTLVGLGLTGAIPSSVFTLPRLTHLDVSGNALSGSIPPEVELSPNLRYLSLAHNKVEGVVPAGLLTSKNMDTLLLQGNLLTGVASLLAPVVSDGNETDAASSENEEEASVSFVTTLDVLDLSDNVFTAFPHELEVVGGLSVLYLHGNSMTGVIPPWLGQRDTLKHLRLDGNSLTGSLAIWLSDTHRLLDLQKLRLDGNAGVTGPLTAGAVRTLAKLTTLNVSDVQKFGAFPSSLGQKGASLTSLTSLSMRNSGLSGTLPPDLFEALPLLQTLDLRDNLLTGLVPANEVIPAVLDAGDGAANAPSRLRIAHQNLQQLLLANNSFGGMLPHLPAHLVTIASGRHDAFGVESARAAVDLRDASDETRGFFTCPLPENASAYQDARCTCPSGSAGLNQGRFSCAVCEPGTQAELPNSETCAPCQYGSFAETAGATVCQQCPPGAAANQLGLTACQKCALGFFAARPGSSVCDACDPGTFSELTGSNTCQKCAVGSAAAQAGSSKCDVCASGTFAQEPAHSGVGSAFCQNCPVGKFSASAGLTVCVSCQEGYFAGTTGQSACAACAPGSFNPEIAAAVCTACPTGSRSANSASVSCDLCSPGTFASDTGQTVCSLCPVGKFGDTEGSDACQDCALGHFNDEEGSTSCTECATGSFAEAVGQAKCEKCASGSFSSFEGANECTSCALGSFAEASGSSACTFCNAGTFAGTTGQVTCAKCDEGLFSASTGSSVCDSCPVGKFATGKGAAACQQCAPGSFANATSSSVCALCLPGTISPNAQATTCQKCPSGFFNDNHGGTTCTACTPGTFAEEGSDACQECAVGTFAKFAQQNKCQLCPSGTYQNITGQSACVVCAAGTAGDVEGAVDENTCVSCPAGHSTDNKLGASVCLECEAGSYAGQDNGNANCVLASAGYVASVSGAAGATKCAPGTHAPGKGNTECVTCPLNHFASESGAVKCTVCPPGSASTEGASSCNCLAGYRDVSDLDLDEFEVAAGTEGTATPTCLACAPGTSTGGVSGSTRCSACPPDSFSSGNATATCSKISPGFVGSDFLEPTTHKGATTQTACPPGFRSRDQLLGLSLVPQCEKCPTGTVSVNKGSATCTTCAAGFDSDAVGTKCVSPDGTVDDMTNSGDTDRRGGGGGGGAGNATGDYDGDYASSDDLINRASSSASDETGMSAHVSVIGFFSLLGVCALTSCCFARWWRRRRERLRALAAEREDALDAAEEEIARGGKIRRETLLVLANVDAEAIELGETASGLGRYGDRGGPRRGFFTRLNPFARNERAYDARERGYDDEYSGNKFNARKSRATSGVQSNKRMSVAHRISRLDRLDRASRFRAPSRMEGQNQKNNFAKKHRGKSGFDGAARGRQNNQKIATGGDSSDDSEEYDSLLNYDDDEAVFESVVLAAARRASKFVLEKKNEKRRDSFLDVGVAKKSNAAGRLPPVEQKRLLDHDGTASERTSDDVQVTVETGEEGGKAKPWKIFRG